MSKKNEWGMTPQQVSCIGYWRQDPERIEYKAYRKAYPSCKSDDTARTSAARLFANDNIRQYIDTLDKKMLSNLEVTAERVTREKARLAFFDPRKLFHESGELKKIHELDDNTAAAIEGFEMEIGKSKKTDDVVSLVAKIKHAKKGPILDQLSKQLGQYEQDNKQKTGTLADIFKAVDGATRGLPREDDS